MLVAIKTVIDLPDDDPFAKNLDRLLKEFKGYIEPHYFIEECEFEHGENEQREGQAV